MNKYEEFYKSVEKAADRFRTFDKHETIRVISHLDADGISACALLIKVLNRENRKYSITIVPQLSRDKIIEFSKEPYSYFIFTDLGSGQLKDINKKLKDKKIIILDHHQVEKAKLGDNVVHINPHLQGIDGSKEISGSGVTYYFAKTLNKRNEDLAHLAVVGAIGDIQEEGNGFLYLNNEILKTAIEKKKIEVKKGLRLFGMQTKPLHKVLEYSTDPYIPGVTGSESGAIQFLHQIGINPKNGREWKKIVHLNEEDMKKLVTGIIMKRLNETIPDDVLGPIYILTEEKEESPMKDAREFATLLNACGRMEKASFGIGVCLGIKKDVQNAMKTLLDYKKQIVNALNWYYDKKGKIIKEGKFIIINAEEEIPKNIAGTLASIISKSNNLADKTYILTMARSIADKTTKISLRLSGRKQDVDLRDILKEIVEKVGGEAGGHQHAAGALIETAKEKEFVKFAEHVLRKRAMEETIKT